MRPVLTTMKRFFVVPLLTSIALVIPPATQAAVITLQNGDVLNATITAKSDKQVTIQHPVLGSVTIERSHIAALVDDTNEVADATPAVVPAPAVVPPDTGLLGTGLLSGWKHKLELGVNGKNTNRKFRAGFAGGYEDREKRWTLASVYAYHKSGGETSENDFYFELARDWLQPDSPWFSFANARYDWDEFQDWNHRVNGFGGMGYQFIKNDTWSVAGRAGLSATRTFGGEREEFTPESLLGVDGYWQIANAQKLKFKSSFYPNLEEWGEYRNVSVVDWEMKMATDIDLSLKVGVSNEYDSLAEDVDKNTFKYYGGLVWGF